MTQQNIAVTYVKVTELNPAVYNPRKHPKDALERLKESFERYGCVDPIIVNHAQNRLNTVIGGHMRLKAAKELGYTEVPVVYVTIEDEARERELNLRLNRTTGEWDYKLLSAFDESLLETVGFSNDELDIIFRDESTEAFDLKKELDRLDIKKVSIKPGDIFEINGSRLMCGDSTKPEDMQALMQGEKANMVMTDPPYILAYLTDSKNAKGFGQKQDRRYMGTDTLPDNFTELWMGNVAKVAKEDFHIVVYENWKNMRTIWNEMEKHWKVRNMLVWHLSNRSQGYPAKYKFFSKHDIAVVGGSSTALNLEPEEELFENEYQTALHAIAGKPHWEGYRKGKKDCPTDFIEHQAANRESGGQGIIFGTKPIEILIPYIKVMTKRGDLVLEPFGGSGSTLIASLMLDRRCCLMEKSPIYAEVIKKRWENLTGKQAVLVAEGNGYGA